MLAATRSRRSARRKAQAVLTFEEAAHKTHAELSPTWKNPKDRAAFLSTLETYIFPHFGAVPLPEVTSADIRQAILAAREKVPHLARKLVYRISYVFKWGIAEGMCSSNPSTAQSLALPRVERKAKHRKALPYSDVAGCIETVHASRAWKATKLAMEILAEAADLRDGSGLVFPSLRGKVLSDMTLSKLVKELGFDADIHGFRTSFRTWAQERKNYPREVAEAALAHKTGDAVEQAYARSDVFEKRRKMMESWAAFLSETDAKVARIG
ncbi:tyrosine-type recombinase/integrase [Tropicimonas sp. TH_r6]|uniref:tyrosine-type recombinase/integrase n=1 Tax=Tropicimonas sp. TH_r6 TaxID=3082085 RepID=UPI0039861F9A